MDNNIIIFKTEDEQIKVNVRFYDESVWLTIDQIAEFFSVSSHPDGRNARREIFGEFAG